ncbi:MAG: hypothetical protein AAF594_05575, partial [Bacteroidota bacterium]
IVRADPVGFDTGAPPGDDPNDPTVPVDPVDPVEPTAPTDGACGCQTPARPASTGWLLLGIAWLARRRPGRRAASTTGP